MREIVATSIALGLATLLVASAAAKAVSPGRAHDALRALGVPEPAARAAVPSVVVAEWAIGVGVIVAPRSAVIEVALVALFGAFAALGAWALLRGRVVECGCFGPGASTRLGTKQLYQLIVVAACAVWIDRHGPSWTVGQSARALLVVIAGGVGVLLATAVPTWRRIRRDRISLASGRAFAFVASDTSAPRGGA